MEIDGKEIDAVVSIPYTQREIPEEKRSKYRKDLAPANPESTHRLSHFSARAIAAAFNLGRMYDIQKFILTGEEENPSTADLEENYLRRKEAQVKDLEGIDLNLQISTFPNRNGTQQQLDAVADLQSSGQIGRVMIPVFEFHVPRVTELVSQWGIQAEITEIELAQEMYLQYLARSRVMRDMLLGKSLDPKVMARSIGEGRLVRDVLVNLPQVREIAKAEQGIPHLLSRLDAPFGRRAPFARTAKAILGPTITDIDQVGMPRLHMTKSLHTPRQRSDLKSFVYPGKIY